MITLFFRAQRVKKCEITRYYAESNPNKIGKIRKFYGLCGSLGVIVRVYCNVLLRKVTGNGCERAFALAQIAKNFYIS